MKQIGAALVDVGVLLVPENVAAFGIEEDDALRQDIERFAQPRIRLFGIGDRGLGFAAGERKRAVVTVDRDRTRAARLRRRGAFFDFCERSARRRDM